MLSNFSALFWGVPYWQGVEVGKGSGGKGCSQRIFARSPTIPTPHHKPPDHTLRVPTRTHARAPLAPCHTSPCYLRHMDNRLTRRRRSLFTQSQLATLLGCSTGTVKNMERSFLTDRQRDYLNAVGYSIAFYPRRKAKG